MTALCATAGCAQPAAGDTPHCVGCGQHRELLDALSRARPKLASPHNLGTERTCANCVWFVEGDRQHDPRDNRWNWNPVWAGWGDCRTNAPRPVDGDIRHFPRTHRDDWCRMHAMRRDHHRPGQP